MRLGRPRLILVALVLFGPPLVMAGCAFEGQIAVQLLGSAPVTVKQSAKLEFAPQRVHGRTTRAGQVVRIDWQFTTTDARVKLKRLYPTVQLQ